MSTIDRARLDHLAQQKDAAAAEVSKLTAALIPLWDQRNRLNDGLQVSHAKWEQWKADAIIEDETEPQKLPEIDRLVAEIEKLQLQITALEEERSAYRENVESISTLIVNSKKFLENTHE
jgi:uncharacterized protein YhaN